MVPGNTKLVHPVEGQVTIVNSKYSLIEATYNRASLFVAACSSDKSAGFIGELQRSSLLSHAMA